jgi:hypothetical protein
MSGQCQGLYWPPLSIDTTGVLLIAVASWVIIVSCEAHQRQKRLGSQGERTRSSNQPGTVDKRAGILVYLINLIQFYPHNPLPCLRKTCLLTHPHHHHSVVHPQQRIADIKQDIHDLREHLQVQSIIATASPQHREVRTVVTHQSIRIFGSYLSSVP